MPAFAAHGAVLTLNAGSSSLKLALFDVGEYGLRPRLRGTVDGLGASPCLKLHTADGAALPDLALPGDAEGWVGGVLAAVRSQLGGEALLAVGHRVVHGGLDHAGPVRVTAEALRALEALTPLAPLHQGHNLGPIRAVASLEPDLPQVACFDTAFHRTLPDEAARFAIPRALHDAGVRRYGAHGLSYEFIAGRLAEISPGLAAGRVVVAHLGSGASLCALQAGRSVDTTMGLTPLDGLMMATRCGALDPGAVLYLQQSRGLDAEAVQTILYHGSGLLGVSGRSSDIRDLLAADDAPAREAVGLFVARLAREIAAMTASMGGLDALVFTGGIGQHQPAVRAAACARLGFLGVVIDEEANRGAGLRVSADGSLVLVLVLPTDEEIVIARHVRRVLEA